MDKILEITELIDKIFNTDLYGELEKIESIAQLVPWLAGIVLINIPIALLVLLILNKLFKNK